MMDACGSFMLAVGNNIGRFDWRGRGQVSLTFYWIMSYQSWKCKGDQAALLIEDNL